jgi:hypothetical protein
VASTHETAPLPERSISFYPAFVLLLLIQMLKSIHRLITLLLVFLFLSSPLLAQQRRNAAPKKPVAAEVPEPPPTFDTLLSADSYKVYGEARGVGGLIRSSAVNDLLDPVMKLGGPPKEFKTLVKWLNAHAEVLAGSRMLVAGWPSRPKIPNVLVAIEFSSPEEAKKFYPELRGFLPKLLPTPTPTPTAAPAPALTPAPAAKPILAVPGAGTETRVVANAPVIVTMNTPQQVRTLPELEPTPVLPPYQMQQAGSLILISDVAFTFRNLKPRGSKPLEEDQNFTLARNRFASESLFLYVDLKSIEKEEKERQKKWEEEEQKRIEAQAANPPKAEEPPDNVEAETTEPTVQQQATPPPEPEPSPTSQPTLVVTSSDPQTSSNATLSGGPQRGTDEVGFPMMFSLYGALFGGEHKWPEAVSAALVFEGDAYVLRTLVINDAENKGNAIPFIPQFLSGPALVPESPNIFPADTDLFVSFSLDYPQVYEGMLKALANAEEQSRKYRGQPVKDGPPPESPFAIYEKKLGLKIKDDLLPLLGNEIALALPKKVPSPSPTPSNPDVEKPTPTDTEQRNTRAVESYPVVAISVKDREAVARLIPKIVESLGFKGANLLAQTEKRDGTELTSYGNVFAYAFVGDFLVVSADAAATRHVVDAYVNHQTLSSDSHFRNFTRWQPRQVLGQVYVAPGLVEEYTSGARTGASVNDKMSEFLSRVNPVIDPLTYALTNDGQGPLHELHVPKNLLQTIIARASSEATQAPLQTNEAVARSALQSVARAEASFQAEKGNGRYATLDELLSEGLVSKELIQRYGYTIELTVLANKFEAIAIPVEYGKTGKLSFFIDESGVLRAGDHGGGAATAADVPVQ